MKERLWWVLRKKPPGGWKTTSRLNRTGKILSPTVPIAATGLKEQQMREIFSQVRRITSGDGRVGLSMTDR